MFRTILNLVVFLFSLPVYLSTAATWLVTAVLLCCYWEVVCFDSTIKCFASSFALHKHITVADFTSLFSFAEVCVTFFFICGCSLVSLLCYYRLIRKKNILYIGAPWFVFPLILIRFACCCHDSSTHRLRPTVWIRYIMFCLPSLMMFAIYIKIQSLNYLCYPPAERPFHGYRFNVDVRSVNCVPVKMIHSHRTSSNNRASFIHTERRRRRRYKWWF